MSAINSVRISLKLLSHRDQVLLWLVVFLQFLISFLDLVGVILLGTVTALAAVVATNTTLPDTGVGMLIEHAPDTFEFVVVLAVIAGVVLVLKSIIGLLLTRRTFKFLANRQAIVAGGIAARLLSRPLLEVRSRSSQETTIGLTAGVAALTLNTLGPAVVIASELSLLFVLTLGLLLVDPLVAIFTVMFFSLLVILLQYLLGAWATRLGRSGTNADIGSYSALQHALRAYREITVSGRRGLFISRFQSLRWDSARVIADQFILGQVGKYVFEIGLIVGGGLLVMFVALTRDAAAAIAIITVFLASSARLVPSLLRLQAAFLTIRGAEGTGTVTLALLDDLDRAEARGIAGTVPAPLAEEFTNSVYTGFLGFTSAVSLNAVSLGYPGASELALNSVSLEISPGQSIALVGTTGAGKSTLADVILGVLIPDSGSVTVSGLDPQECVRRWPGAMAYVPQDVAVLTGTVRENVALGIPADFIDDSLVWEALERAQLSTFLQNSREGIDTVVGENGVQLSGGQRQRLGIARALYSRPKLLVLDEATSALDAETEQMITQTLDSLEGDVTLIVIAHRLATVRHCDQVIHLAGGRVTGRGSFEEVRALIPEFDRQAELLGL